MKRLSLLCIVALLVLTCDFSPAILAHSRVGVHERSSTDSGPAGFGPHIAYVSVGGDDANPCTLKKPCRTFNAALGVLPGETWSLWTRKNLALST